MVACVTHVSPKCLASMELQNIWGSEDRTSTVLGASWLVCERHAHKRESPLIGVWHPLVPSLPPPAHPRFGETSGTSGSSARSKPSERVLRKWAAVAPSCDEELRVDDREAGFTTIHDGCM